MLIRKPYYTLTPAICHDGRYRGKLNIYDRRQTPQPQWISQAVLLR